MAESVYIAFWNNVQTVQARRLFWDLHDKGYEAHLTTAYHEQGPLPQDIRDHIEAHPHFIVFLSAPLIKRRILAHMNLLRGQQPDWLSQELEHAIRTNRNIIPIALDGFRIKDYEKAFQGDLGRITQYNMLEMGLETWDADLPPLFERFLQQRSYGRLKALSPEQKATAEANRQQFIAAGRPSPTRLKADQLFFRGHVTRRLEENIEGALECFEEALQTDPEYYVVYRDIGLANQILRRFEAGMAAYAKVIEHIPADYFGYYGRGTCRFRLGLYEEARHDFDEALRIYPEYVGVYNNRAFLRYQQGDFQGAVDDSTRALQLNPNEYFTLDTRAQAYFILGQYNLALDDFRKAYSQNPGQNVATAGLALTYHVLGRTDEALRLWRSLISRDERYKDIAWVSQEYMWQPRLRQVGEQIVAKLG